MGCASMIVGDVQRVAFTNDKTIFQRGCEVACLVEVGWKQGPRDDRGEPEKLLSLRKSVNTLGSKPQCLKGLWCYYVQMHIQDEEYLQMYLQQIHIHDEEYLQMYSQQMQIHDEDYLQMSLHGDGMQMNVHDEEISGSEAFEALQGAACSFMFTCMLLVLSCLGEVCMYLNTQQQPTGCARGHVPKSFERLGLPRQCPWRARRKHQRKQRMLLRVFCVKCRAALFVVMFMSPARAMDAAQFEAVMNRLGELASASSASTHCCDLDSAVGRAESKS